MTVFFGCWGDLHNTIKDGPPWCALVIKAVAAALTPTSRLVIAGDNYYMKKLKPPKDKSPPAETAAKPKEIKRKIFDPAEIYALIELLGQVNVPTTVLYGNHEWDKFNDQDGAMNVCKVEHAELSAIAEKNETRSGAPIHLATTLVEYRSGDLWVMLDTSMYEYASKDQECYPKSIEDMRREQLDRVMREIPEAISLHSPKRLFIVGHHPICIFRQKEAIIVLDINATLARVVSTIMDSIGGIPVCYLCADFHVYQHQELKINGKPLEMHIVGTGGAVLDEAYRPKGSDKVSNAGQMEMADVTFYGKHAEPLDVVFNTDGSFVAKSKTSEPFVIESRLIKSEDVYGYLNISDDVIDFVPVRVGGRTRRKSPRRRKSRTRRRRKLRNSRRKTA
jgi:hypothetical protein